MVVAFSTANIGRVASIMHSVLHAQRASQSLTIALLSDQTGPWYHPCIAWRRLTSATASYRATAKSWLHCVRAWLQVGTLATDGTTRELDSFGDRLR